MQAHLTHGSLVNAAFVKRPFIDFKKFIEKALSHRDAAYHREATLAAKDFIGFMESGKNIYAFIDAGRAKRTAENKKILTSIVKTIIFLWFQQYPFAWISRRQRKSYEASSIPHDCWGQSFEETLWSDGGKC